MARNSLTDPVRLKDIDVSSLETGLNTAYSVAVAGFLWLVASGETTSKLKSFMLGLFGIIFCLLVVKTFSSFAKSRKAKHVLRLIRRNQQASALRLLQSYAPLATANAQSSSVHAQSVVSDYFQTLRIRLLAFAHKEKPDKTAAVAAVENFFALYADKLSETYRDKLAPFSET